MDRTLATGKELVQSIRGKNYECLQLESTIIDTQHGLPKDLYHVLLARMSPSEITDCLDPKLKNLLPDPYVLPSMEKACERTLIAIKEQEKIGILGDYDVDGACSAALLIRFFKSHGIQPEVYIPDRLKEGYGPNDLAFQFFKDKNCTLIFTVDCGTAATQVLNNHKDLDIVVLDHHLPSEAVPDVFALVNPQLLNCHPRQGATPRLAAVGVPRSRIHSVDSEKVQINGSSVCSAPHFAEDDSRDTSHLQHLSAGGVTFLFLIGLNRLCMQKFDLMSLLDLVALSTVCDVMPLKGLNRAFVKQGIRTLQNTKNLGIQALCTVAGLRVVKSTYDLGFIIGPRINAGGRLGQSYLGVNILTTEDPRQAAILAEMLDALNKERQKLEEQILESAVHRVKDEGLDKHPCILVFDPAWHAGIVGIIAARIREIYNKPTFVAGSENNGIAMGSARSIDGVNIGGLLGQALEAGLIISGGGHTKAGGFKCIASPKPMDALYDFLNQQLISMPPEIIPDRIHIKRKLAGIDTSLIEAITKLEPFGSGHEEPLIAIENVHIKAPTIVKDQHVRCYIIDGFGCTLPAMSFRALRYGLKPALFDAQQTYTCIGYLKNSPYGLQFQIHDLICSANVS
jgi:single-stranded-DNA-specific exonuclease